MLRFMLLMAFSINIAAFMVPCHAIYASSSVARALSPACQFGGFPKLPNPLEGREAASDESPLRGAAPTGFTPNFRPPESEQIPPGGLALCEDEGFVNPGKATYTDVELAEQSSKMDALAAKWRDREIEASDTAGAMAGWVLKSEQINGRLAMFFLLTGLITEYYTGESVPQQVATLLRSLAIID